MPTNDTKTLIIEAAATAGKNLANVSGIAYSGNPIRQWWSNLEMIVDLAGMEMSAQIPLLLSHFNEPEARLGVVEATVENGVLLIKGGIDTGNEKGREIVEKGKVYEWQLSIGADIIATEHMQPEEQRAINGKLIKGEYLIATKTKLREVSVVAVGADADTHMQIAASFNHSNVHSTKQGGNMDPEKKTTPQVENPAPAIDAGRGAKPDQPTPDTAAQAAALEAERKAARQAETDRITAINKITAEHPEIRERAISAGWTEEYTKSVITAAQEIAKKHPQATGNIIVRSGPAIDAKAIEASLCLRAGIAPETIEASCGRQALDIADAHLRGLSLKDVMVEVARCENQPVSVGFSNETIRAAFSTTALPGLLSNTANKAALKAFNAQESIASKICSAGDLNDFKVSERYRLTDIGDLQIIPQGGEIKSGTLGEDKATNQLTTYGKLFTLTREMIYNDDLGEFLKIPIAMGMRAKRKIDQVFFQRLLSNPTQADGNALFSAAHKNYKSGTTSALGVDSLENAIALFMDQVDSDDQPIAVSPKFLLVPTNLYPLAQRLTMSTVLIGGSDVNPAANVIPKYNIEPVASPYLDNAKYTNHSDTGWYLFGDPSQVDTFEIGYFQGRRQPTVERGETDFNVLGISFRVYFDFGIREQDHRGMEFNKGKN